MSFLNLSQSNWRMLVITTGLAALLMTSACASKPSVSENQCRAGDWESIGFRDGASGLASTRILAHQEACGAFTIVPDRVAYLDGWQHGLENYCTADNGFLLGQGGRALNTVCADELREPFASAYFDGREIFKARREVNRLASLLAAHESRLVQIKEEMVGATTAQLVPDLTAQERLGLLAKLEALAEERAGLKGQLPEIEYGLVQAESRLAELDHSLAIR